MLQHVNLFLHGTFTQYNELINPAFDTIAADGGVVNALRNGCVPKLIVGDGDSLKEIPEEYKDQVAQIPFHKTPDQDYTDFEKALKYIQTKGYSHVSVYCFQGDRLDHMLAGLSVCTSFPELSITIYTASMVCSLLPPHVESKTKPGELISLIPYPSAEQVRTTGLQWNLDGHTLLLGNLISISNKTVVSSISISYESGKLFIFRPIKIL